MVLVIITSLYRREGASINRALSLDNYVRILTDTTIHQALLNSLEVVGLTVALSTLIAYPFAYIIAFKVPSQRQPLLLLLTVLPFWTSYVVRSYSWLLVLAKNGVINQTLVEWGRAGRTPSDGKHSVRDGPSLHALFLSWSRP